MTHLDPFLYTLRVRYQECDAQKVVFNARYSDYIDIAVYEFTRAIGYADQMMTGSIDYQLVKQTVEWKAPARFDQTLALSVSLLHLGTTSFTLRTEFRIHDQPNLIASAETVYVCVHLQDGLLVKMPMPPHFRQVLQSGARGIWVNHAGKEM